MSNNPRLLCVDGIQGRLICKAAAEVDHALRKANLAQTLVPLLLGNVIGGTSPCAPPPLARALRGIRRIVDDLIVDGVVRGTQGRVEYGKEAELCWDEGARCRHCGGRHDESSRAVKRWRRAQSGFDDA